VTIRYVLTGGRSIPGHDERLEIDGGRFRLRRTTGGPVVGRFSGELPPTAARSVDAAADAVRGSTSLHLSMSPGASRETIEADGTTIEGDLDDAPEAWSALVERLRDLVDRLVDAPEAAIALEVDEDGRGARLVHRGSKAVEVDLSETRIAVSAWHGYYEPAGRWERGPLTVEAPATAEPGWRAELPFEHDLPTGDGFSLQVETTFAIRDDDGWRPVGPVRVPVIDPPR
jgi:hypothetical protein